MQSAFGVEHGEISKARRKKVDPALAAQRAASEAKVRAVGRTIKGVPGKIVGTKVSIADVGTGASKTITGAGRLVAVKPGLTGAALVGGGGYALYRHGTKPKKKHVAQ
jgi:hypothetical protein